jgi:hypothetical protein
MGFRRTLFNTATHILSLTGLDRFTPNYRISSFYYHYSFPLDKFSERRGQTSAFPGPDTGSGKISDLQWRNNKETTIFK